MTIQGFLCQSWGLCDSPGDFYFCPWALFDSLEPLFNSLVAFYVDMGTFYDFHGPLCLSRRFI